MVGFAFIRRAVAVSAVAASLWAVPAHAQNAERLFATAQELYEQKQCEAALPLFNKLYSQTRSPNARLYIGRCLRQQGQLAEAHKEMRGTLAEAERRAAKEERYVATRDAAAAELKELEGLVGKLAVTLKGEQLTDIRVGGITYERSQLTEPIVVNPGEIEVTANSDGQRVKRTVIAAAGEVSEVELRAKRALTPQPPTPASDATSGGLGGVQVGGLVLLGLGAGAMAGFAATTILADQRLATLEEECGGVRCTDPAYADIVDEGKSLETISYVSLGGSVALLAAGSLMLALGSNSDDATSDGNAEAKANASLRAAAVIVPLPGGAAFSAQLSF